MNDVLRSLTELSRCLGGPDRAYAILGEGSTSARVSPDTFVVKASGMPLAAVDATGFVELSISRITDILGDEHADDAAIAETLRKGLVDPNDTRRPSLEALLHAYLLQIPEYAYIAHTQPVHVSMLLCSPRAQDFAEKRITPGQIACMGRKSVFVQCADAGLALVREAIRRFERFVEAEGELPRTICMANHGLIAMGASPQAVSSCIDMAEKAARIIAGAYALGGPHYMTGENVARIHARQDEE